MADLETFRTEVSTFVEANAPEALRGKLGNTDFYMWGGRKAHYPVPESRQWLEVMAERGWTVPSWPKEHGGAGLSKEEAKVISQELKRLKVPAPLVGFGIEMIGPTLQRFGNEQLQREHLPRIARGEIRWCQGYSEPNAGSDLASVQTQAVRDGDEYVLNGQKIWTSYGDQSDWMFLLVRTDPDAKKQAGITFLLMDLDSPGVEVKPIRLISGASPFCETFFSNVRVPTANVVDRENAGWTVAKALLGFERNMIAETFGISGGGGKRGSSLNPMLDLAREYVGPASGPLTDGNLRDRITQLNMDFLCFSSTVQRSTEAQKAGHRPGPESSMFKVYGTELNMRREELAQSIMGPEATGWEGDGFEEASLARTRSWLRSRGNSIEGGTSEIQLNIIAKRVLDLPEG